MIFFPPLLLIFFHNYELILWLSLSRKPSKTTFFLHSLDPKSKSLALPRAPPSETTAELSRGTKYNHADVHRMAQSLPHITIITSVTITTDIPTTGSNRLAKAGSVRQRSGFVGATCGLSRFGPAANESEWRIVRPCFNLAWTGEPGWLEPAFMDSIFRLNDKRFCIVPVSSLEECKLGLEFFRFSRFMFLAEPYFLWRITYNNKYNKTYIKNKS